MAESSKSVFSIRKSDFCVSLLQHAMIETTIVTVWNDRNVVALQLQDMLGLEGKLRPRSYDGGSVACYLYQYFTYLRG